MFKYDQFFSALRTSLTEQTFVLLALSKNYEKNADLKKIKVSYTFADDKAHFIFTQFFSTKELSENIDIEKGIEEIEKLLKSTFKIATLHTNQADFALQINKTGEPSFHQRPPSFAFKNTKKEQLEAPLFLVELGVLKENGNPQKGKGDKYKQINKFVEIMAGLLQNYYSDSENQDLKIVDMGAGKGYLTFALYDFLVNNLGIKAEITGVEVRDDLVKKCNGIAKNVGFQNLQFQKGYIGNYFLPTTDILIALHACDTATDDAIVKGINAQADLIICAPCCHKQVRKLMNCQTHLQSMLQFGIHNDRLAEMLTDTIRALILEANGYETSVSEF
ncbi:MAG: hypothetical protein ACI85O_001565, partial [Saprospiraceae bacterium]